MPDVAWYRMMAAMTPDARTYVTCSRALVKHLRSHGIEPRVKVEFYRGQARTHVSWNPRHPNLSREIIRQADTYLRQMTRLYEKLSQDELATAHAQIYRDLLRPPLVGQVGFEDCTEDWDQ